MEIQEHIGLFKHAVDPYICNKLIDSFHTLNSLQLTYNRGPNEGTALDKKDKTAFILDNIKEIDVTPGSGIVSQFLQHFWGCFRDYAKSYPAMEKISGDLYIRGLRLQKTLPGEGYHTWHFEADNVLSSRRICAWSLYLNTVEEGGETEFLYQKKRYKPEQGNVLIWPAGYTHTHRGNPPLSGEKFLITGWIEF
jgi:hypothetical protein